MHKVDPVYVAHQRKRWMRPDAYHFVRPDWRRHIRPGYEHEFHAGDVLLFRWRNNLPAKHAAIVTSYGKNGADTMVHAHDGAAVAEVALAPWWRRRLAYAFRFPGVA